MNPSTKTKPAQNSGLLDRLHRHVKNEHAVGLDVHDGRIAVSHFIERKGAQVLNVLATHAYDPALSDKELAHCIRTFWKKNNLPTRTVCTCLYTPSLIVRHFSYTNVLHDELPRVLALEAEEALQRPLEDIALSWHLNQQTTSEKGMSGVLVAAPRHTVKKHIKLIKAAGLYPVNVEISCSAIVNLYNLLNTDPSPAPVCLVNLTHQMAGVVILSGGAAYPRLVFSSNETGWQNNLDYLIENIERALLHYQLKVKGDPIRKLLLVAYPRQDHFVERFAEAMSLPVEPWNPYADGIVPRSTHSRKVISPGEANALNLVTSLGLGLRYPKRSL